MKNRTTPLQFIGTLVIDYFRWTQLAPMVTIWFFAALMVFLMFFVNHQDETVDGIAGVLTWVTELPVIGPPFVEWLKSNEAEDGVLHFGDDDFKVVAMKAWVLVSLLLMVLGWLTNLLFGPFRPMTLKRKLGLAGLGSLLLMAGFLGVYFISPDLFNGATLGWILNFSAIALLVFLVSAWCLSIAHALGLLGRSLAGSRIVVSSTQDESKIDTP